MPLIPGDFIKEQLKRHDMSVRMFAALNGISYGHMSKIVSGDRAITREIANKLGYTFKTSPEFWMNLQAIHELFQIEPGTESIGKAWSRISAVK
jgi:addiction module HigA family antidote